MADRRALSFILLLLFFLLPGFLPGQEPEDAEGEEQFIQRLVWEKTEHTYRYEITVEMENGSGEYAEIHRESRIENFIELSLSPGLYRYRIEVYNLLNRSAGFSEWIPFRVLPALQPELWSFSQEFLSGPQMAITLYGKNLVEGAELYLQPLKTGEPLTPLELLLSGERVRLVFDQNALTPGRYRVYVRNPGGLESSLDITVEAPPPLAAGEDGGASPAGPTTVPPAGQPAVSPAGPAPAGDSGDVPRRFFNMYLSAEYAPLIPLTGYLFDPFTQVFYPGGVSFRIGVIPIRQSWGDLGLELAPSWNMLKAGGITIHMGTLHLNGVYQWWFFRQTMVFLFRLGAGINLEYGTGGGDQDSGSIFTWMVSAGSGIFLRWFMPPIQNSRRDPRRTFYLETGAEYIHLFAKDSPTGYIKPVLGAGWRF
jgi:hypothetical protein